MKLPALAVRRPVATATILILILLIGLVSLYQSPLDLLPDIQAPVLAVITAFPGSSPQETLELVTRPIEGGVAGVSGLTGLNSFSQENLSLVILQFDWGVNVRRQREDVAVRLELLDFPDGVQRPMILEFDPTLMPIMQLSASGAGDPALLTVWLEETAVPRLESVDGVASVQIQGASKQDLFVRTSPDTMAEYQVSFEQIANVLRAGLTDFPAGIIDLEDRQVRIRFLGRYADAELLSDLVVGFEVDNEALNELVGREVDINLNQLLAGNGDLLSGRGVSVPVQELYWDDVFDFSKVSINDSSLTIPLQAGWAAENGANVERRLLPLTVNPGVSYDPVSAELNLALGPLGRSPLSAGGFSGRFLGEDLPLLEDVWIIEEAVWDDSRLILPLDPNSLDRLAIEVEDLEALGTANPLIAEINRNYLLLTLHPEWEEIRNQPIYSLPDYGAWLSSLGQEIDRGIGDAARLLEESLTEMATTMIVGSMGSGNALPSGFDFGDDFPIEPVSLGMIAEIEKDTYNLNTISRYNRQPSIGLSIQKEGDANTVLVARRVRAELENLSEEGRANLSQVAFNTVFDQAEEIELALADLAWALLGGAFLAITVLILFLRNWRTTLFIGISIPAAIIATFSLLYFADLTINLMTLGGLALAAGMLVDNSIVVSENIYRHYQMGEEPAEAAVNGAVEVAGAITASTLTTISVFFPVVFLSGLAGQIFWEFALTVACAILASLLVALTVIPLLASRSLRLRRGDRFGGTQKQHLLLYRRLLRLAINRPWWVFALALLFVASGVYGYTGLGTELFPNPDESAFSIDITFPPGTTMVVTDQYAAKVEEIIETQPGISSQSTRVGGGGFMGAPTSSGVSNQARIRVEVAPAFTDEIDGLIERIRAELATLPAEAEATFTRESLLASAGFEPRLDLVVSGESLDRVSDITERAASLLAADSRYSDVQSSLEESRPEIHIRLDQGQALQKGVTLVQVATAVRQALEGIPVSRIESEEGILNIVLGYQKSDIQSMEDLGSIGFYTPGGEYLQLKDIATLEEAFGPQSISRQDQKIVGSIQAQYGDLDLGSAGTEALAVLEEIELPPGYAINMAGSSNLMGDAFSDLQLVMIMAFLLVYLVMAAQFESLLYPLMIIFSLPLAITGAILALVISGYSLSIPAMIGIVVLAGILVNDGIIMVDYINQQRRLHGMPVSEAIVEGAATRLRPILMTTITTMLGLLPLALGFGEGSQIQAPMAIAIIGGQLTGTLLLLLVIPSVYMVLSREKVPSTGSSGSAVLAGSSFQTYQPAWDRGEARRRVFSLGLLRMVLVIVLIVLILILAGPSGPGLLAVIR